MGEYHFDVSGTCRCFLGSEYQRCKSQEKSEYTQDYQFSNIPRGWCCWEMCPYRMKSPPPRGILFPCHAIIETHNTNLSSSKRKHIAKTAYHAEIIYHKAKERKYGNKIDQPSQFVEAVDTNLLRSGMSQISRLLTLLAWTYLRFLTQVGNV